MKPLIAFFKARLAPSTFYTWGAWIFGLLKIRMIWYLKPRIVRVDEEMIEVRLPLTARAKNHLGSMYFGALCVGADVAGGLLVAVQILEKGLPVSFVFADATARFLKRPEADAHFICRDGAKLRALVDRAMETGEREAEALRVTVTVPTKFGDEPVAEFDLTLSVKKRG